MKYKIVIVASSVKFKNLHVYLCTYLNVDVLLASWSLKKVWENLALHNLVDELVKVQLFFYCLD